MQLQETAHKNMQLEKHRKIDATYILSSGNSAPSSSHRALGSKAPVTSEAVAHMKSRIIQFDALTAITSPLLRRIPHCASTWCAFVVRRSMAYASRVVLQSEHIPIDDADL